MSSIQFTYLVKQQWNYLENRHNKTHNFIIRHWLPPFHSFKYKLDLYLTSVDSYYIIVTLPLHVNVLNKNKMQFTEAELKTKYSFM